VGNARLFVLDMALADGYLAMAASKNHWLLASVAAIRSGDH
jgi:hypothetical protein